MGRIVKLHFPVFVFLLLFGHSSLAQTKCGTHFSADYLSSQSRSTLGYFSCNYINRLNRQLQITVHIAKDSLGATNYDLADLDAVISKLNTLWQPTGLIFNVCEINIVENHQFDDFSQEIHEEDMLAMHFRVNTINLFLVDTVITIEDGTVSGYTTFPGGKDFIIVDKEFATSQYSVVPHEMGHFLGLYHTYETAFGAELVNGSNCETTGDLICDTEADPSEFGTSSNCNYVGTPATDANSDFYIPSTNNIMSAYPEICVCWFTPQQYNRMLEQYLQFRAYLD